jgi:hypothetical protein
MPTVTVEVDIDDVLDDLSDKELEQELERRRRRQGGGGSGASPHPWTNAAIADDLRTAFYARNGSRFEALLAVLDPPRSNSFPARAAIVAFADQGGARAVQDAARDG